MAGEGLGAVASRHALDLLLGEPVLPSLPEAGVGVVVAPVREAPVPPDDGVVAGADAIVSGVVPANEDPHDGVVALGDACEGAPVLVGGVGADDGIVVSAYRVGHPSTSWSSNPLSGWAPFLR